MDNPFTPSRVVTGESFCNRRKELKELSYYVQNNQTVLLYSRSLSDQINYLEINEIDAKRGVFWVLEPPF